MSHKSKSLFTLFLQNHQQLFKKYLFNEWMSEILNDIFIAEWNSFLLGDPWWFIPAAVPILAVVDWYVDGLQWNAAPSMLALF